MVGSAPDPEPLVEFGVRLVDAALEYVDRRRTDAALNVDDEGGLGPRRGRGRRVTGVVTGRTRRT